MDVQHFTVEQLIIAGGHRWMKSGKDRIYFNDLAELFGVTTSYYNTGNVSGVWVDGAEISNNKGRLLLIALSQAKFWFDVPTGTWQSIGLNDRAIDEGENYGRRMYATDRFLAAIADRVREAERAAI